MDVVSLAAEFPNDNPALHRGVSWVCLALTGPAVAISHPVPEPSVTSALTDESVPSMSVGELMTAGLEDVPLARISGIVGLGETPRDDGEHEHESDDDEPILVEELPPLEESASLEGVILPPPCDDPWTVFVAALADVAIGAGSPHVAAVLPGFLADGTLGAMPEDAAAALAEAGFVRDAGVTPAFVAQTAAWRAILLGTSNDLEACGGAMLDEWAADVLARLLGAPSRATLLRRELRSRGVAAFGLASAA